MIFLDAIEIKVDFLCHLTYFYVTYNMNRDFYQDVYTILNRI